jgi:hypothetical protein
LRTNVSDTNSERGVGNRHFVLKRCSPSLSDALCTNKSINARQKRRMPDLASA